MSPSVSPEAEWELTEGAFFYAREGGAELGLAFITEFERTLALLTRHVQLGAQWRKPTPHAPTQVPIQHHLLCTR